MKRTGGFSKVLIVVGACVIAVGVCAATVWIGLRMWTPDGPVAYFTPDSGSSVASEERAKALKRTEVVPTLDTPIPKGKNVIWCGSFQMAWNRAKDEVVGGPIRLSKEQALADSLNRDPLSESDLPAGSYYAAAGFIRDGIVEKVQEAMQEQFKKSPHLEGISEEPDDILAYAYLVARVPFTIPFCEVKYYRFVDSAGRETIVSGFGTEGHRLEDKEEAELTRQVEILFAIEGPKEKDWVRVTEFALDPCRTSAPNQIILACVPRQESLQATWAYAQQKIEDPNLSRPALRTKSQLHGQPDQFLAPDIHFSVDHHFGQLEGAGLLNQDFEGYFVSVARQLIDFRLDRSGAILESEGIFAGYLSDMKPIPRLYLLDRPFLVVMRKRGGDRPFFMMWVDNAELLCKPSAKK